MAEVETKPAEVVLTVAPVRSSLSQQPKAEEAPVRERAEAVTKARLRKRSRLKEALFGEHAENIGEYVLYDVAIPALKATFEDMFGQGLHMLFYGEPKRKTNDKATRVSYGSVYRERERERERPATYTRGFDSESVLFESAKAAEDAMDSLMARCERYNFVTVIDFYDVASLEAHDASEDTVGWYMRDLQSYTIRRVYDKNEVFYVISLPRPIRVV